MYKCPFCMRKMVLLSTRDDGEKIEKRYKCLHCGFEMITIRYRSFEEKWDRQRKRRMDFIKPER